MFYICYWFCSTGQTTTTRDITGLRCYIWHCLQRLLFHGHSNCCLLFFVAWKPPEYWSLRYHCSQLNQVFLFRREKWNTSRPWSSQVVTPWIFPWTNPQTHVCTQGALLHWPPHPGHPAPVSPPSSRFALPHLGKEGAFSLEIRSPSPSLSLLQLTLTTLFLLPSSALSSDSFGMLWPLSGK